MVELIKKKRDGQTFSQEELREIVSGFVSGSIPDYQMSALLMAIYFKGMEPKETALFTELMMRSGEVIDLSEIPGIKVDKHSTGGVGDKTTLILGPLVAAAGVPVAKMSGRGLGHTGGTIDKLESIKGMEVEMSKEAFIDKLKKYGIAVCGQNANLVPADKKLYALRDVTGTVDELALISSSIMSKKLACGADAIVIDIKVGDGAYMKTLDDAIHLGLKMKEIGENMGRKVVGIATGMEQPLGRAVGNALEVKEAIATLQGRGPEDLVELCLSLGSQMLILGGISKNEDQAKDRLKELIQSGAAFDKFKTLVSNQGGDVSMVENTTLLPSAKYSHSIVSIENGFVTQLKALDIGKASVKLGAGRETKDSIIDFGAGIYLHKKIGDKVEKGERLVTLYSNNKASFESAANQVRKAYKIEKEKPVLQPLIMKVIK